MGAAVAALAVASTAAHVNHLVLESPFNNLADEVYVFVSVFVSLFVSVFHLSLYIYLYLYLCLAMASTAAHVNHLVLKSTFNSWLMRLYI